MEAGGKTHLGHDHERVSWELELLDGVSEDDLRKTIGVGLFDEMPQHESADGLSKRT